MTDPETPTRPAGKVYTPIKAIRHNCIDCMAGNFYEVRRCPANDCPLWPYRLGHRPPKEWREPPTEEAQ